MREPDVVAEAPLACDRGDAIIGRCPTMLEVYKAIGLPSTSAHHPGVICELRIYPGR